MTVPGLKLLFLGPPQVELAGRHVAINRRKALALLAYLAVTSQPQRRDTLSTLLWPDSGQESARKALRRDLSELNLALGGHWLDTERERVGLHPGFWLDVTQFQQHLDECTANPAMCPQQLEQAVALYRGNFLEGFTLADSPVFDEWQFFQAETLRQACASTLEWLVLVLQDHQRHEHAVPNARRWLALDPLHEPAHRQLMQLYAQTGQQAAALRQYERCREILDDELGVPPSAETTLLYEQIRERKLEPAATAVPRRAVSHAFGNQLPAQTTPFIGRQQELAEIRHLLLDEPACRLLNLFGPGGIGKTRLALAAAMQILELFPDGVYFVALASVGEAAFVVPAIAEALRFTFDGDTDPTDQLLAYLHDKKPLLVLDNFEHLLDGADLLSAILQQAPAATLLTTSRERLHLQEEWVYEVQGLPFPAVHDEPAKTVQPAADLNAYAAVQLFLQRARQTKPRFAPTAEEMAAIGRICQLVAGMPLGVELAAPWIRTLSCQEIAAEIEHNLDFLTSPLRNLPERHRSLRVVLEQTWQQLPAAEQAVLRRLSVFRGGSTREAAEQVTAATIAMLSSLVDKALLRRTSTGRYELHELIRQFAEQQLQTEELVDQAQRHQNYFIAFLETRTDGIKGARQKEILNEIRADMDNIRLVWRRVVENRDAQAIERSSECLFVFYVYNSGHYEGQVVFQQAVAALATLPDAPAADVCPQDLVILDKQKNLVGFLLAVQAYFLARTSGRQVLPEQAIARLIDAEPGNQRRAGVAYAFLAWAVHYQGRIADSIPYAELALTLSSHTGDALGEWWSLIALGGAGVHGKPAEAELFMMKALAVSQKSGDPSAYSFSCQNLGFVSIELGKYREAAQFLERAIIGFEELGNTQGLGTAFLRAGQLATALGDYAGALQNFGQTQAYFDETRSTLYINFCRIYLGIAYRLQGDHRQAEQTSRAALATFKAMNDPVHAGYCLLNLGCVAYDQGDLSQAEQMQREALDLWQQAGYGARVADASRCLGHVMVAAGEQRHAEAKGYFRQALELTVEHQMAPVALDVCVGVACLQRQAGDIEGSFELLALAANHEASTFETKQNAQRRIREWMSQLPPAQSQAAQTQGQTRELWATVEAVIASLAA